MKMEVFIVAKWERKLDMKWILFFGGLLEELSLTFSKEKQIQQLKKKSAAMYEGAEGPSLEINGLRGRNC